MTLAFPRHLRVSGEDVARARLVAALAAADRGWHIFPLRMTAKRPIHKHWETEATCDPDQIRGWWRCYPYANIGIACQPSHLLVVDLDGPRGPIPAEWAQRGVRHGRDSLALIAAAHGQADPVDTFTVATPRAGEHRYFCLPDGVTVPGTVGARGRGLGWGIDTRNRHGLVTASGSVQVIDNRIVPYRIVQDVPVAAAPPWLITALSPSETPNPVDSPAPSRARTPDDTSELGRRIDAYVTAAINGEAHKVRAAAPGHRHITLYAAAAALGELAANDWLSDEEITAVLTDAARPHIGIQDFTADEVADTIRDGIAKGRTRPRVFPRSLSARHYPPTA